MTLPDGIRLRPARRGDRDGIYTLLVENGVSVAPLDQSNALSWIVSHPECEVTVAVDPVDRLVGFISFSHRPRLRVGGRLGIIDEFVVSESQRRRGIGSALLNWALSRARILGCKRVELSVGSSLGKQYLVRRGFVAEGSSVMGISPEGPGAASR